MEIRVMSVRLLYRDSSQCPLFASSEKGCSPAPVTGERRGAYLHKGNLCSTFR